MTDVRRSQVGSASVVLTLLALIAFMVAMAYVTIDRSGSPEAGVANLRELWWFWITSGAVWLGLSGVWWSYKGQREDGSGARSPLLRTTGFIVLVAVVVRVIVLITHDPSLSDDVYRYVFDGRNLAAGSNPYLVHPIDSIGVANERWPGERTLVPLLAYPELPTPYLPVSHYAFGAMGFVVGGEWADPISSARVFRVGFVACELVMIAMLVVVIRRSKRSPWMLALYAWHPLPIAEIAGSGHQDIIGITLLVTALLAWSFVPTKTWRWTTLLALSAMVKPVTIPVAAFMLRGRPWQDWLKSMTIGAATCAIILAPLWILAGDSGRAFQNWRTTATFMSEKSAHFAGPYETAELGMRHVFPDGPSRAPGWNLVQEVRARKLCVVLLGAVGLFVFVRKQGDVWSRTAALMLATVLVAPSAQPWYLLWGFALFPLAPSATMWVYSLTISFGYVYFATGRGFAFGEIWTLNPWVLALGYVPVLITLGIEWWFRRRHGETASGVESSHAGR